MKAILLDDTTAKVQVSKAAADTVKDKPFQREIGSWTTRNGCVFNPIGGGWAWLSAFASKPGALQADLLALESAEFADKPTE